MRLLPGFVQPCWWWQSTLADTSTLSSRIPWCAKKPFDNTVGGSYAVGGVPAGGLRLLRYGSMRANVMGVEAVTGTGEVLDLLSTCRKDNTGCPPLGPPNTPPTPTPRVEWMQHMATTVPLLACFELFDSH